MSRRISRTVARLETVGIRPLQAMADAALRVAGQTQAWAETGVTALHLLIGDQAPQAWRHYPDGDARDAASGYRWYYHCHDGAAPTGEHGHFHLFSECAPGQRQRPSLTHLVAIAVDDRGLPLRAFTCNRWVTDEVWRDADQVLRRLARFRVHSDDPALAAIGLWLTALTRLFAPQLQDLVVERDAAMARRAASGRRPNLRDDRRLDVISECRLSLPAQIDAIQRCLGAPRRRPMRAAPSSPARPALHEEHAA